MMRGKSPITLREGIASLFLGLLVCATLYAVGYLRDPIWAWSNLLGTIPILGLLSACLLVFLLLFGIITRFLIGVEKWKAKQKKNS